MVWCDNPMLFFVLTKVSVSRSILGVAISSMSSNDRNRLRTVLSVRSVEYFKFIGRCWYSEDKCWKNRDKCSHKSDFILFPTRKKKSLSHSHTVQIRERDREKSNIRVNYLGIWLLHNILLWLDFSFHRRTNTGHTLNEIRSIRFYQ